MIISANRLSSINGKISIGINENYGSEDLGRILMEDAMNDMAIFNAAMMQDMQEIKVRQEGTMLESEIQALSEGAVKDFCKKIVEKLKSFWAKMKAWFKTAIANISAYIVRDGQAFVKMHLKDIGALKGDDECGDRWCPKKNASDVEIPDISPEDKAFTADQSVSDMMNILYKRACKDYNDGDTFYDVAKNAMYEEVKNATVSDMGGTSQMMDVLRGGKKGITTIKKAQQSAEKDIKKLISDAERKSRTGLRDEEAKKDAKDSNKVDAFNKELTRLSNLSSASTSALSTICKTLIKLVKFDMAQCRKALATAIGRSARAKTEATLLESLLLEADEEIEQLSDNEYASDLTPAEEKAVEELVDAIEEKIEGCDDSGDDE